MAKKCWGLWLACLFVATGTSPAWAQNPTPAQILSFRPRMDSVDASVPSTEEQKSCSVEGVKNNGKTIGWLLVDGKKQPVRRFIDSNGDNKLDVWSYFKDGKEIYREVDSNGNERPDQFRWYNSAGMRWGVDSDENGRIESWRMISAEEVGQEAFEAIKTRDFERLNALLITQKEMRTLKLPADRAEAISKNLATAAVKFQETVEKLKLDGSAKFVRVEGSAPECVPAESTGMDTDMLRHRNRMIFYEHGQSHSWLRTGELIQIGLSWRLVSVPTADTPPIVEPGVGTDVNPELEALFTKLTKHDNQRAPFVEPKTPADVQHLVQRIEIIEQILKHVKGEMRDNFFKQMIDNLASASVLHPASMTRLETLHTHLEKTMPGSPMAGYAAYRELTARYLPALSDIKLPAAKVAELQEKLHEELAKFVTNYPNAEDAPDALLQLAVGSEFAGKDEEAKRRYRQIYTTFPEHGLAAKSKGAEARLSLVGNDIELHGTTLGSQQAFNINKLQGKVVVVYYWASYVGSAAGDFAGLKKVQEEYGPKGVEIVTINLDDDAATATNYLQAHAMPANAVHLYEQAKEGGGLNSRLALQYGINGLPTVFLVGRDGKVLNRNVPVSDLETALKRGL